MSDSRSGDDAAESPVDWDKSGRLILNEMLPLVYKDLRRVAKYCMSDERADHTLPPAALVHETYLRLLSQRRVNWRNRSQLLGLAASMMRRILFNYARDRRALKRGGINLKVPMSDAVDLCKWPDSDLLMLKDALTQLAAFDSRKSRIVRLKFFVGLSNKEISKVLEISTATVEREWRLARDWLYKEITLTGQSTEKSDRDEDSLGTPD